MIPPRDVLAAAAMRSIKNESGRPEFTIKEIATRFLHCEPDALRKRLTNLEKSARNSSSSSGGGGGGSSMLALSVPAPVSAKRRGRPQTAAASRAATASTAAAMAAGFTVVTLLDVAAAIDTTGAMLMTEDIKENMN